MGKYYFRIMFSIYTFALMVCGALRVVMKLWLIDPETGFYTSTAGEMPILFYVVFGSSIIAMTVINRLRRGGGEYPIKFHSKLISVLRVLAGCSILAFVWLGLPQHFGQSALLGRSWELLIVIMNYALGSLSGLFFVISGFFSLCFNKTPNTFMMVLLAVWQIILLLSRFNGYFSILYISDNLLIVLFMVFAALFYMGHARTICGIGRKDGRNYVISAGLAASLCGLLSSVPNIVYMLVTGAGMPIAEISVWECVYTLVLSIYALYFVAAYSRSIEQV